MIPTPHLLGRSLLASTHRASPLHQRPLYRGPVTELHPIIFDSIDARLIRSTSLRVSGAAGPSGLDAHAWRRLCTAFKTASDDLCQALADFAKRLCISLLDPRGLAPFLACRLIALDKCPGVRPLGIGDTARRIIAKAVLAVIREDVQDAAGSAQLCAGQISGCEAAVHSVRESFQLEDTEAALLVDASNAFNSINRMSTLKNIQLICPPFANILINCYRDPTKLFIDGDALYSQEGTTQGDPLGMPMYALATVPLIDSLNAPVDQVWYADDAAATGKIANLRTWWDGIVTHGPGYGYHANASKTWLVVKEEFKSQAEAAFADTAVKIMCEGRPHLGAPWGRPTTSTSTSQRRYCSGHRSSLYYLQLLPPNLMLHSLPIHMGCTVNGHTSHGQYQRSANNLSNSTWLWGNNLSQTWHPAHRQAI